MKSFAPSICLFLTACILLAGLFLLTTSHWNTVAERTSYSRTSTLKR